MSGCPWRMNPDVDVATGDHSFYVWPENDTSYMKVVWKNPTKKYPNGFHVLGTKYHPVGDFDRPDVLLPNESLRIYQTRNGYRVFFTGRYNVNLESMFNELDAMGGDPLYSKFARQRRYFAMRIEPKEVPAPQPYAIARLVEQTGQPLPEWKKLIEYHDAMVNAFDPSAILV